ncbi:MAG: RtcB family protein [Phycisphaerae bacterium]
MKARELINLGFRPGPVIGLLLKACQDAADAGLKKHEIRERVRRLLGDPESFADDRFFSKAAEEILRPRTPTYEFKEDPEARSRFGIWGEAQIDPQAIEQMVNAVRLPISIGGALMPDAHLGYGLPIGGVLATEEAVIPYAVGVDIACRMMLSVLPISIEEDGPDPIRKDEKQFIKVIERNTRFGLGARFKGAARRRHEVMDRDWSLTPITARIKTLAYEELGTSGGGNHFVDVGELEMFEEFLGLPAGRYVAILSHSGSRGPGHKVCAYYSKIAQEKHAHIPRQFRHLAWLPLSGDGAEYWAAMELMGDYASANHHCIHETILRDMNLKPLLQVENHHNFAWRETHHGRDLIVHRKGATPAGEGAVGIIPGSMAAPGFLVEGKGESRSYDSAAHGAGRAMSRRQSKETFRWSPVRRELSRRRVKLVSAGLDEVPGAYKNIESIMAAQSDLVDIRARFDPRIVKMADDGYVED